MLYNPNWTVKYRISQKWEKNNVFCFFCFLVSLCKTTVIFFCFKLNKVLRSNREFFCVWKIYFGNNWMIIITRHLLTSTRSLKQFLDFVLPFHNWSFKINCRIHFRHSICTLWSTWKKTILQKNLTAQSGLRFQFLKSSIFH